jgi:hypothetical protein
MSDDDRAAVVDLLQGAGVLDDERGALAGGERLQSQRNRGDRASAEPADHVSVFPVPTNCVSPRSRVVLRT